MTLEELDVELANILRALLVDYKKSSTAEFVVPSFGVVVCGIDRLDYKLTNDNVEGKFKGYRSVYITTEDLVHEKRLDIIWALMRSGYMRYIRTSYTRQFKNLLVTQDFGRQIVNERLRIWGDKPKYAWLAEENKIALTQSAAYILTIDPSFYDSMPEEV